MKKNMSRVAGDGERGEALAWAPELTSWNSMVVKPRQGSSDQIFLNHVKHAPPSHSKTLSGRTMALESMRISKTGQAPKCPLRGQTRSHPPAPDGCGATGRDSVHLPRASSDARKKPMNLRKLNQIRPNQTGVYMMLDLRFTSRGCRRIDGSHAAVAGDVLRLVPDRAPQPRSQGCHSSQSCPRFPSHRVRAALRD